MNCVVVVNRLSLPGAGSSKVTTTTRISFSKDGKTRSQTSQGTNAKGQKVNNAVVYDK